jgi:hypothetical protein
MNEFHQLATALLAIAFAAVMLVAGQLFIENRSARLPAAPTAPLASVPWDKPSANLPGRKHAFANSWLSGLSKKPPPRAGAVTALLALVTTRRSHAIVTDYG